MHFFRAMFCCDLRRSSSMMTFWANCSEDGIHFLDFVSLILANVGVRPKLWQSRRNSMAPAQWTFFSHFTFDNDDMKSLKRQVTFFSLIFLLKLFYYCMKLSLLWNMTISIWVKVQRAITPQLRVKGHQVSFGQCCIHFRQLALS